MHIVLQSLGVSKKRNAESRLFGNYFCRVLGESIWNARAFRVGMGEGRSGRGDCFGSLTGRSEGIRVASEKRSIGNNGDEGSITKE